MHARTSETRSRGARLLVNPHYNALLERAGLTRVEDFLALPAVIIWGHRGRHVAQLELSDGAVTVSAFLKREHSVPWKVYLASAWAGFGWVSRSYREALTLRELQAAGVPCPDWIAAGEDGTGRAFLLMRAVPATELRDFLRIGSPDAEVRRTLVRRLGQDLARLHDAGFHHADLHSKHVFVSAEGGSIYFLDWQRSRRWPRLPWRQRLSDLAALDATLDDALVSPRERLRCLRAYFRAAAANEPRRSFSDVVGDICRQAVRLLRKRYIREVRQASLPIGQQNLIWLDGEALCVTSEFQSALRGKVPSWLVQENVGPPNDVTREEMDVPGAGRAVLVRRWVCRPLGWLWQRLRGQPFTSPELRQAAVLFRLQRYGLTTPRLLAVGQRYPRPWRSESFLLTEPVPGLDSLPGWLASRASGGGDLGQYRRVVRESGSVVRRLHEAGCYLAAKSDHDAAQCALAVQECGPDEPRVVVSDLTEIQARRRPGRGLALRDLARWRHALGWSAGRTDALRFLLAYLGQDRLTPAAKQFIRSLCARQRRWKLA